MEFFVALTIVFIVASFLYLVIWVLDEKF